jgi:hypothetical protein
VTAEQAAIRIADHRHNAASYTAAGYRAWNSGDYRTAIALWHNAVQANRAARKLAREMTP